MGGGGGGVGGGGRAGGGGVVRGWVLVCESGGRVALALESAVPGWAPAAAGARGPHVRLGKLDTEAEQRIAGRYGIRGTPTMILFRSGKEIARTSGAMPAAQIAQWARSHV